MRLILIHTVNTLCPVKDQLLTQCLRKRYSRKDCGEDMGDKVRCIDNPHNDPVLVLEGNDAKREKPGCGRLYNSCGERVSGAKEDEIHDSHHPINQLIMIVLHL